MEIKGRIDLKGMTAEQLTAFAVAHGMRPFRGKQLAEWLYRHGVEDLDAMTNIARVDREELARIATVSRLALRREEVSTDGTRKFLFELGDGRTVETVLIPDDGRRTLCISTQVGCAMGCTFCLTARQGLERDLTTGEIVDQLLQVQRLTGERVTNVVFMGMGEPLHNYLATVQAVRIFTDSRGFDLSTRRVTVSTAGLLPRIEEVLQEPDLKFALAVSLNATTDALRDQIMPLNRRYPIQALLAMVKRFNRAWRDMAFIEYVLLSGVNDSDEDAHRLARLLKPVRCKVNLIPYNAADGADYRRPDDERVESFREILLNAGYTVLTRRQRGADIRAACGQLRQAERLPRAVAGAPVAKDASRTPG
ncbi:MAG: 23S rRNA (adenine(2503)-C(2))-methyltransferase RlmN [Nitrospirota bacterium]|jgi:23S rRNA (adenine2503-C2)-methyltransferase